MTILLYLDNLTNDHIVLQRAMAWANASGQALHVVKFAYEQLSYLTEALPAEQVEHLKTQYLAQQQQQLTDWLQEHNATDAVSQVQVLWHKHAIDYFKNSELAEQYQVLFANRGRGTINNTVWQLVRHASLPVWLVTNEHWQHEQPNILLALDLATKVKSKQKLNRDICQWGAALSPMFRQCHLVSVLPLSPVLAGLGFVSARETEQKAKQLFSKRMTSLSNSFGLADAQHHMHTGEAAKIIVSNAAKLHCQLVVLGSVARKGLRASVIGNTAEDVLTLIKSDVLVVMPS